GDLISTKNLSYQTFRSVSHHGAAELLRRGDPQPADAELIRENEERRETAVNPGAVGVDPLKIGAAADPLASREARGAQLFAANSETLPALRTSPLQHQTAVFRAHSDEKPMRPLAVAGIGLEGPLSLHVVTPERLLIG